jgi:general secretion pathway protein G
MMPPSSHVLSRRSRVLLRGRARGVTLIEVMIVVVILGLIAGGVAVAVLPQIVKARIEITQTNAKTLRGLASTWRSTHATEECPTPARLKEDKVADRGSPELDAWGTPFKIVCHDDETSVVSLGPDKRESDDDIVEPAPVALAR